MAEKVAELGPNLALFKGKQDELKEQDINAHVMPPEMLERLAENMRKEKRLESLPFAKMNEDGTFELISGHHRVRASRMAQLPEIYWMADTRDLPRSAVVAKQLAHNSLSGKDDPQTLKRLYEEMDNVDDILESFLRAEDFDDVKQLEPAGIVDISVSIPFKHLTMVFLPKAMKDLDRIETYMKRTPKETDTVGVVAHEILDKFRAAALALGRTDDIRSLGAIVTRMSEITMSYIEAEEAKNAESTEAGNAAAA